MDKTYYIVGAVGVAYNADNTADLTLQLSETAPGAGPNGFPAPQMTTTHRFPNVSDAQIAAARATGATVTGVFTINAAAAPAKTTSASAA